MVCFFYSDAVRRWLCAINPLSLCTRIPHLCIISHIPTKEKTQSALLTCSLCASSAKTSCSSIYRSPYILSMIQGHSVQGHRKQGDWGSAKVLSEADSAACGQLLSFSFFSFILVTFAATDCPATTAPHWHLLMKKKHSRQTQMCFL